MSFVGDPSSPNPPIIPPPPPPTGPEPQRGPEPHGPIYLDVPNSHFDVGTIDAVPPAIRSMTDGAVTHISDLPLTLRTVDPAILANWDQPQPQLPQRSPPFVPSGPVEPPLPPLTRVVAHSGAGFETTAAVSTFVLNDERNLSLQPEHVASQARRLVEAIRSQIAAMPATPNEPDKLEFQKGLIEFLEGLAARLNELAETLDQMVANRGTASEPIFLGKAAIIANHLSIGAMDYIANHREKLAGAMIQGGLIGTATLLAMSLGIDKELLELIGKIFGKGK